jgi:predicted RNA-binding protein with PIN domain
VEKILIDGYNLLHKDGALKNQAERNLEQAREELIARIGRYRSADMEIVVVFDGRGGGSSPGGGLGAPGVQVRFSRFPQSADQLILEILEKERRRDRLTVVTSDRKDIGRTAQAEGARWVSSESFLRRLRRAPRREVAGREKPGTPSSEEVDYWMKRFRSETGGIEGGSSGAERPSPASRSRSPISRRRRTSR